MLSRFFSLLLITSLLTSCSEEVTDFINISILPSSQYEIFNSDEIIPFTIKLTSNNELTELLVIETINNSTIDTILVKLISGNEHSEFFNYSLPSNTFEDTSEIKLIFCCSNNLGERVQRAKIFYSAIQDVFLTETTGHTMFSNNSSEYNAYNLLTGTPSYNTDTSSHILDNTDSLSNIISREWISNVNLLFSKNNSFDYANATFESVKNTYNNSLKKEFVDQISEGDIITTKIENSYLAIKIIYVIDEINSENDRYIFSIKK
ncbi:hypothetical protein N9S96_01285 [Flavobacteriales bacterium]|nr:hypothetical protein [Flavobacteriales bacterium]